MVFAGNSENEMDSLPWADAELSMELPGLRSEGEGPTLEYKREFPAQAHEMAAEIAAFATSGGGRILVGVADDGTLVGLDAASLDAVDRLKLRAQGIVKTVKPGVKAHIIAAAENGKTVLCIQVGRQDEPVYYYDFRPYIRVGSMSRPADPDEVKQHVWAHPSAEYRRKTEELELLRRQAFVEQSIRTNAAFAERNIRSSEDHANHMRALDQQSLENLQRLAIQNQETTRAAVSKILGR
jgi:predicted HTH transcriptional regulator